MFPGRGVLVVAEESLDGLDEYPARTYATADVLGPLRIVAEEGAHLTVEGSDGKRGVFDVISRKWIGGGSSR